MKKIGIIGAGNIGTAIANGFVNCKKYKPSQIMVSRKNHAKAKALAAAGYVVGENEDLVHSCDLLILAVLPGQVEEVLSSLKEALLAKQPLLMSAASAVSSAELKQWSGLEEKVLRIMPNTAVEYGAGMVCISGENEESLALAEQLFSPLGQTMVVKEALMPAATIMAACGIAFFLRYIRAVSQGGIQIGFHADEAGRIAAQTARGAAELLLQTGNHPESEIDRVTTPMGCTISGLNEMEHFGLSSSMIKGIVKSFEGISDLK